MDQERAQQADPHGGIIAGPKLAQNWPLPLHAAHSDFGSAILSSDNRSVLSIKGSRTGAKRGESVRWLGCSKWEKATLDEIARIVNVHAELVEMVKLFERSLVYEVKKSDRAGDDEGANLKFFTLAQVRDVLAKATAMTAPQPAQSSNPT